MGEALRQIGYIYINPVKQNYVQWTFDRQFLSLYAIEYFAKGKMS